MKTLNSAGPFIPQNPTLKTLKEAVNPCQGCDLYKNAEHAVFGEGPLHASILFIEEQPGDREDLAGKPFVGPTGKTGNFESISSLRLSHTLLVSLSFREYFAQGRGLRVK